MAVLVDETISGSGVAALGGSFSSANLTVDLITDTYDIDRFDLLDPCRIARFGVVAWGATFDLSGGGSPVQHWLPSHWIDWTRFWLTTVQDVPSGWSVDSVRWFIRPGGSARLVVAY